MRTDAIFALKRAEEKLATSGRNGQNIAEYEAAFDMAKRLTAKQYESMLTYYKSNAYKAADKENKIKLVQDEINKLNDITYNNYYKNGVLK